MNEDRKMLEKIEAFVKVRLDLYGYPTMCDDRQTPLNDLLEINIMIDTYKKYLRPVNDKRIHPNAIARLGDKKKDLEIKISDEEIKKDLIGHDICPECSCDLDYQWYKWYEFGKPMAIKTCKNCGFKTDIHRTPLGPPR